MNNLVELKNVRKSYFARDLEIPVLKGIDFCLMPNDEVAIVGASGSGKSTFLNIVGGIDQVTSGEAYFDGQNWDDLSEADKALIRQRQISFIFQLHHLIRELTVLENVMLPLRIRGEKISECREQAQYWLNKVSLLHRAHHYPSELSGGEMQRTSLARALITQPRLILADEPTGSLDSQHALKVQDLLFQLRNEIGTALIVVTHDLQFAKRFKRILHIRDGQWIVS